MNKTKQQLDTIGVEAKLKAFIGYRLTSFPECGLLSRQIEERQRVFVIKPYGAGARKDHSVRARLAD